MQAGLNHKAAQEVFITRANIHRVLTAIIAANDQGACRAACSIYAVNERALAESDPLRRPGPRVENIRIGKLTVRERFLQKFVILEQLCQRICDPLSMSYIKFNKV